MKIGITIVATNSYIVLGIKLIKRFMQFYTGNAEITFYLSTEEDPRKYLPDNINVVHIETHHKTWVDGTNSKFSNIIAVKDKLLQEDYVCQLDADTDVYKPFDESWFIGESVAGQHFDDQGRMKEKKAYDRNPRSKAYVPLNTKLNQVYVYGAFFAFSSKKMIEFCETMIEWQLADRQWGYEPGVNDESYINKYFHYNPPTKLVLCKDFVFDISHKAGIGDPRHMNLDVSKIKEDLLLYKNDNINIQNGKVICEK